MSIFIVYSISKHPEKKFLTLRALFVKIIKYVFLKNSLYSIIEFINLRLLILRKFVFYISIFILSWVYALSFNAMDWDLPARLTVGKIFFQTGSVPAHDFLSYTPTKPLWIDHEWGSGVIFYFLADRFGDIGLMLLKVFGIFIVLFLISKTVELNSSKKNFHLNLFFYLLVFYGMFAGFSFTVRCQMFTFMFFALWIYILERIRHGENRLLWVFPVTMLIWANLHGGFVAGLGLLLMYTAGEFLNKKSFKKYIYILVPTVLITLINPYGTDYWVYLADALTMHRNTILEWKNSILDFPVFKWWGYKLLLAVSIISALHRFAVSEQKFKIDYVKLFVLAVTAYLSVKHVKHQAFFAITAGCFLYYDFYGIFYRIGEIFAEKTGKIGRIVLEKAKLTKDAILYGAIILCGSFFIAYTPVYIDIKENEYPVGAIEFIKANELSGNLLALFHWGSYAAWKLYPSCLIAIDGRYEEVYSNEMYGMLYNFYNNKNKNWAEFIKKYHTDMILIEKNSRSAVALLLDPHWKRVYYDNKSVLFVRSENFKKNYIIPKINKDSIIKDKYKTDIDF
jgi:hypothetical protein